MKRRLLHLFRRHVPEPIRAPLRAMVQRSRSRTAGEAPRLSTRPDGNVVLEADFGPPITLTPTALEWARYQFWSEPTSAAEMRQFVEIAGRHAVFVDVGAHFGIFSTVFATLVTGGRALAFEPVEASSRVLREHLRLNGVSDRVEVIDAALGASPGEARAIIDPAGFAAFGRSDPGATSRFEVRTLDGEVERTGLRPDLLKVDVEGFELEVLRGGSRLLRDHRPFIFLELHLDAIEARGGRPTEVVDELVDAGYSEFRIDGSRVRPHRICDAATSLVRLTAE
jgi:FkbM family methyltransferase